MTSEIQSTQEVQDFSRMASMVRTVGDKLWSRTLPVAVTGAIVLAACGSDNDPSTDDGSVPTEASAIDADGQPTFTQADLDNAPVVDDAELRDGAFGDFLCGGTFDPEGTSLTDFSYKYDFFSATEENESLAVSMADVHITDTDWGMGESAFAIYRDSDQRLLNGVTLKDKTDDTTTGSVEMDEIVDGTFSLVLDQDITFGNGDCRTDKDKVSMLSPDVPLITIEKGSSVEALPLTMSLYNDMMEAAEAEGDTGMDSFLFIDAQIPQFDENGEIFYVPGKYMVISANGCDNPIRVPRVPEQPETPSVTTTSSVPPSSVPPSSVPPEVPPTTDGRKADVPVTSARPPVTNPADAPVVTYGTVPATAPEDPTPPNITIVDDAPTPNTIQEPDQPMTPDTAPATIAPASEDVVVVVSNPADPNLPPITVEITPVDTLGTGGGTPTR